MNKIKLFGSNPLNQILIINVLVYILGVIIFSISTEAYNFFQLIFSLKSAIIIDILTPFSFITHGFLHVDFLHLLGNLIMFGLYYPIFSNIEKDYVWKIYLTSVFITGIFFILYINWYVFEPSIVLGMSGGLLALISYCCNRWDNMVLYSYGKFNFRLKYLLYFHLTISIMNFLDNENTGGEVCHLIGIVVGWYMYKTQTFVVKETEQVQKQVQEENKKSED